ncbi:MAG: rod shape-determining protein MreC [Candidatus Babeliales bacterium]|nr:rod shape-determining protein MreC [Candidatus Babeliales bacterium]
MYKTSKQYIYVILFIFITLFYINKMLFLSTGILENTFSYITHPILNLQNRIVSPIRNFREKLTTIDQLQTKLTNETKERENLLEENIMLKSSLAHMEQVIEYVGFKKKYDLNNAITTQIIMREITDQGHYFYIDKGSNSQITKDMIAVYKNCLVGKIIEVFPTKSRAVFITDSVCKVAAFCFKTGAIGIYEGINETNRTHLSFVSHLDTLAQDDLVISSGEGLIFPKGLGLGKIIDFKKVNEVQYEVNIKPLIDINTVSYCCLVRK